MNLLTNILTIYTLSNPYLEINDMIKTDEDSIRIEWYRSMYLPRKQKKRVRKALLLRAEINNYGKIIFQL